MAFSLKAIIKSFGFQWILVKTWMNKMGDNTSYLAQLCTTILASSPVQGYFLRLFGAKQFETTIPDEC